MVKRKVGGGKRYKAVQAAQTQNKAPEWDGPAPPSHMQRKITRKVQFLEKVAAAKASQPAKVGAAGGVSKKSKKKAKPLPSLADLAGTLEDVLAGKQGSQEKQQQSTFGQSVGTLKARTLIMNKESARLHQVLNHPQFKADPIAAITNHIQATMPPAPAKPQPSSQQQKKKKKKKRQQGGNRGMDME